MAILVSTTWKGPGRTALDDVLSDMTGLDIDGVELGSTHVWERNLLDIAKAHRCGRYMVHNYFPPAIEELVINLASLDHDIRRRSVEHAQGCLRFAAELGAELYTVHPGFVVEPQATESTGRVFDFAYGDDRTPDAEAFRLMTQSLDELLREASRLGVGLALETQGSATQPDVSLMERIDDYERLFQVFPSGIGLNFNLAHTIFAAGFHGYSIDAFAARFGSRFVAMEISHNDGSADQHGTLESGSFALKWLAKYPNIPAILEFRNVELAQLQASIALARAACGKSN